MALSTSITVVTRAGLSSHHHYRVRDLDSLGIATFSNFKTGSTNVHSVGVEAAGINVLGADTPIGTGATIYDDGGARFSGIITASRFVGDISQATGGAAGLGTALSQTQTDILNKVYYTNRVLSISTTTTVDPPATASAAYTQYTDIAISNGADLIVKDGDELVPDVLGLSTTTLPISETATNTGGRLRVGQITNSNANGAPNFPNGLTVTGIVTASTLNTTTNQIVVGSAVTANSQGIDVTGIVTATSSKVGSAVTTNSTGIDVTGVVTATSFKGDGANLTNVGNTGSLQVLEQFYLLADGRSVSTSNGTVTTPNVTSYQALTDVYAVMDGSTITYQPPAGTTEVIYEYRTVVSEYGSNNRLLYGWYLAIDNTMITESREVYMNATGGYVHDLWVKHNIRVNTGGSDSSTTGDRAGLPSMELKVLARRWGSTYPANAHFVTHFPPTAASNLTKRPHVGITAIGSV